VLAGRGLCDDLITGPEESYRLWCVVLCDLENLKNEEAMTRVGSQRHRKKCSKLSYFCIKTAFMLLVGLVALTHDVVAAVLDRWC
jgi:hypothetical protein